jgi:hypothetical protein
MQIIREKRNKGCYRRLLPLRLEILCTKLSILLTTLFYPLRVKYVSLKGKLFHATKENTELKQEVTYLTARLEKTKLSEKIIEDDLSWVEESATKSTYKLGVGFERYDDKGEKSDPNFIHNSNYHKEEEALKPTKTQYPSNPQPSFNPKREVKRESPKLRGSFYLYVLWSCWSLG